MTDDKNRQATEPEVPIKENAAGDPQPDPGGLREVIQIDLQEYDPESPRYDPEKWEEYQAAAKRLKETMARTMKKAEAAAHQNQSKISRALAETIQAGKLDNVKLYKDYAHNIAHAFSESQRFMQSETWQKLRALFREILEAAPAWFEYAEEIEELTPYIETELEKPEYEGKTITELLDVAETDDDGNPLETTLFMQALAAARKARDADKEVKENLPSVTYKNAPTLEISTDKLMTVFFGVNAPEPQKQANGQMSFIPVKYEKDGRPEVTLYYNYFFDDEILKKLNLDKKINDEDFFILSFIANFWRAGDTKISLNKLYREMVGDDPNTTQKTELTNKLIKLATTNIFINDLEVRQSWNLKTYREGVAQLAPIEVGTEKYIANGQIVQAGIKILGEPVIMRLGYEMGQITTIPKAILHVKKKNGRRLNRTPRFYRTLRYLIRRIAAAKNGRLKNKILYEDFYENTGETSTRDQQLAKTMLYTILDHFKECEWITGYKEDKTPSTGKVGVKIFFSSGKKIASKKK